MEISERRGAERARALLVTSNGTGMGHLTRMLAVALVGEQQLDTTIMSLSIALPVVHSSGVRGEYCLGPQKVPVPGPVWEHYLSERIVALVKEIDAQVVAFDGVAPYRGVLLAARRLPHTRFAWIRRGMWQPGVNGAQLAKASAFDLVIEPGDLAAPADRGLTSLRSDAVRTPPVSMIEAVPPVSRLAAAEAIGIDPDRRTVLVTLGSGRLGDVEEATRVIVDRLLEDPDLQVVVTTSGIAVREAAVDQQDRLVVLRGVYPLVRYLHAFDAAVSAAGYNAVHELLLARIPTLLVPNADTRTDDQVGRAAHLAQQGLALSSLAASTPDLQAAVDRLMDPSVLEALRSSLDELPYDRHRGGAHRIGELLSDLARQPFELEATVKAWRARSWIALKEGVKRLLGHRGSNAVRRILGRPPILRPPRSVAELPRLTQSVSTEDLRREPIVEHLLPGSSKEYRQARQAIIERFHGRGGARW